MCIRDSLLHRAGEGILTQTAGEPGLVLADLTLDGGDGGVDRREHIRSAFTCPEPGSRTVDGEFHVVLVLLYRKDDECFRILLKKARQLHDLFLGISVDIPGKLYFFLTVLEFHMRQLLSFHRFFGVRLLYHIFPIPTRVNRPLRPHRPAAPPWSD